MFIRGDKQPRCWWISALNIYLSCFSAETESWLIIWHERIIDWTFCFYQKCPKSACFCFSNVSIWCFFVIYESKINIYDFWISPAKLKQAFSLFSDNSRANRLNSRFINIKILDSCSPWSVNGLCSVKLHLYSFSLKMNVLFHSYDAGGGVVRFTPGGGPPL